MKKEGRRSYSPPVIGTEDIMNEQGFAASLPGNPSESFGTDDTGSWN